MTLEFRVIHLILNSINVMSKIYHIYIIIFSLDIVLLIIKILFKIKFFDFSIYSFIKRSISNKNFV